METDIEILDSPVCWLHTMETIMTNNPQVAFLGSLIDTSDFVDPQFALNITNGDEEKARFLAKTRSPERRLIDFDWGEAMRDIYITEPPFPLTNPPGRLKMLRTDVIKQIGFHLAHTDHVLAKKIQEIGYKNAITPQVVHRHLSLSNIFDYEKYATNMTNQYLSGTDTRYRRLSGLLHSLGLYRPFRNLRYRYFDRDIPTPLLWRHYTRWSKSTGYGVIKRVLLWKRRQPRS